MLKKVITTIVIFLAVVFVFGSPYTVGTVEDAVVIRMGDVKKVIVSEASDSLKETLKQEAFQNTALIEDKGLFFKIPFIDKVRKFDNRLITYSANPRTTHTNDKKSVRLWDNAQWRIENVLQFYLNIGTINQGNDRLGDVLYSELNAEIGKTDAYVFLADKEVAEALAQRAVDKTNEKIKKYGMFLQDDRVVRDYPLDNLKGVFQKMISERQELRNAYISDGRKQKEEIVSAADKEAAIVVSNAERDAEIMVANAKAEAAKIIAEAYGENPEFYMYWKQIETYKAVLPGSDLFMTPESSLFKMLYN